MKFVIVIAIPIALLIIYKIAQSVTPDKPIEYTIIASLFGLVAWLGRMVFSLKADEGSLKSQIDSLKEEKSNIKQKISQLEEENVTLQEQISKYTHKDSILSNYEFIEKYGIFKHKTSGFYYCHKCLIDKTLESPLRTQKHCWNCAVCNSTYRNPDYNPPIDHLRSQGRAY